MTDALPLDSFILDDGMRGRAHKRTPAEIEELAASIEDRGQQTPVEYFRTEDGHALLTKGYGRIAAMRLLTEQGRPWPTGPHARAIQSHRQGKLADVQDDLKLDGLSENIHRHNLKACDVLQAIEELAAPPHNLQDQDIARRLGISRAYISIHRSYSRLTPAVRAEVDAGRLSFRGARAFFDLDEKQQKRLLGRLERQTARRAAGPKPKVRRKPRKPAVRRATPTGPRLPAWVAQLQKRDGPGDRQLARLAIELAQYRGDRAGIMVAARALLAATPPVSSPGKPEAKTRRTTVKPHPAVLPRRRRSGTAG